MQRIIDRDDEREASRDVTASLSFEKKIGDEEFEILLVRESRLVDVINMTNSENDGVRDELVAYSDVVVGFTGRSVGNGVS